jgi:hypothetical protein
LIFPLSDYWSQLRDGTRDQIIGGIIVAIVLGLAAVFRNTILSGLRKLRNRSSAPADQAAPVLQAPPQEVILKVESVHPAPSSQHEISAVARSVHRTHIPRPPITGFVARRDENGCDLVERLKVELLPEKEQLIVLWGPGGVGKTTLAAETARAMRQVFVGGIIWTAADGKSNFDLSTLLDEIANHLGRPELRQLAAHPKDQSVHQALLGAPATLIVLDNFESISIQQRELCAEWLAKRASCPVLITSREEVPHARPFHIREMSLSEGFELFRMLVSMSRNPHAFENIDHEKILRAANGIPLFLQWIVKRIDTANQLNAVLEDFAPVDGDDARRMFDQDFLIPHLTDDERAVLLALSLFVSKATESALAEVAGFEGDIQRVDRAVRQLSDLWLIQVGKESKT